MTGLFLPILLFVGALLAAFFTYRNIRRGGARFYTLEREIVLRRATVTLVAAVALFTVALGLMYFQRQQLIEASLPPVEEETGGGVNAPVVTTPTPMLEVFPPSPEPTSLTPQPTATVTPTVCRAVVEGTGGNGIYLRDAPQGAEIVIMPEGTLLTVLEDAPVEAGDFVWRKVRAVGGEEGWAAEQFLTIRAPCGEE
ncbi:MAG TPA: SH3 domain-containing protein [Promineifilum sp.]|nr:SH3 domain-containing protein [Promineifilum sp.]